MPVPHEPQHAAMIEVKALTGARFGDVAALRWEDIDWEAGVVYIRRDVSRGEIGATKTRKTRIVGLSSALRETLLAHRAKLEREQDPGLAAGWVFATVGKRPPDAPPNAPRPVRVRYPAMLQKPLDRLLKIAGIDKRITPHGLRRSNVDALRRAGVGGVVEHAMVGHSSERMREHDSSLSLEERREAAERVSQAVHAKDPERELNGSRTGVSAPVTEPRERTRRSNARCAWAAASARKARSWKRVLDERCAVAGDRRWESAKERWSRKPAAASDSEAPEGERESDGSLGRAQ